jgi:hypothetical protein
MIKESCDRCGKVIVDNNNQYYPYYENSEGGFYMRENYKFHLLRYYDDNRDLVICNSCFDKSSKLELLEIPDDIYVVEDNNYIMETLFEKD